MSVDMLAPEAVAPEAVARPRRTDEYHDVVDMFLVLKTLPAESREYARQRERIVTRCLQLADHVARHYDRRGENLEDLTQVARLGLMNAVNRFDPEKSSSFLAFAVPTMMGEVRRHFRDHGWSMHVPRRIRDRHGQITKATAQLTHDLGRAPSASELSELLGLEREEVVESLIAAASYNVHSIDAPTSGGDGNPRMLADTIGDVDLEFDHITDREAVRPLLAALPERDRTVLYLRFFVSMTQSQIAERIGVSQMHVSRILEQTLTKLRDQLQTAGLEPPAAGGQAGKVRVGP
ncbi:MAG: polymerase sigma-B factor [Mycobacterium sp.]|jgi:RNA polymerase sigma-B factor|nr:polymerase sigma-B factor [Mycobacterium sp.]